MAVERKFEVRNMNFSKTFRVFVLSCSPQCVVLTNERQMYQIHISQYLYMIDLRMIARESYISIESPLVWEYI